MMHRKTPSLTLMLIVVSVAVVLSAPKEKSTSASTDRAEPEVITNSMGMKLVRIPAGEFMMGAEEDRDATMAAFPYADPALLPREWPRHKVRITKSFYMGQHEVTLGQFMTFLREAHYQIDAERDGKPMTGYGKNGEIIESTAFRRGRRAGISSRIIRQGTSPGTMPLRSAIG
jgi:sulfatase modifying factor 1